MEFNTKVRRLSWLDHVRLSNLIRGPKAGVPLALHTLERAEEVLDMADQIAPRSVPPTVVTMRSRVQLLALNGRPMEVTLSYPHEANAQSGSVSVFSPLGLSLLGAELGELIEWTGPDGETHAVEVAHILFQPEAAGEFTT